MTAHRSKRRTRSKHSGPPLASGYSRAAELALSGKSAEAAREYQLLGQGRSHVEQALIENDRGALAALSGQLEVARERFHAALELDAACAAATENLGVLEQYRLGNQVRNAYAAANSAKASTPTDEEFPSDGTAIKVAILSFLFNWPSTGGGIVHTVELADFLSRSGYHVRHFYARFPEWGIGGVTDPLAIDSRALDFDGESWNVPAIQDRYRSAVREFDPDYVILTDCWNMKPLLAEAIADYPYILRQQALEMVCPLNNLRLLPAPTGGVRECPLDQLAQPAACHRCLEECGDLSGGLHRAERSLAGVGSDKYQACLRHCLLHAEAVFVHNPILEGIYRPFSKDVRVVTWGMDASRFPSPWVQEPPQLAPRGQVTLIMAGLVNEYAKGFHVLQEACARLWQVRKDFLLVATGDPPGQFNQFTRFTGWLSQQELPRYLRAADMLVMPSVAHEALSRTSVEAMACGRPVVASRIGGLPYTVNDGVTGLLCEPGDPADLAGKIECLLNDATLRQRMGAAGRQRFEEEFTWEKVIERHYRPLLTRRRVRRSQAP